MSYLSILSKREGELREDYCKITSLYCHNFVHRQGDNDGKERAKVPKGRKTNLGRLLL